MFIFVVFCLYLWAEYPNKSMTIIQKCFLVLLGSSKCIYNNVNIVPKPCTVGWNWIEVPICTFYSDQNTPHLSIHGIVCCPECLFIFIVFWLVGSSLFSDKGSDISIPTTFIFRNAAAIRQHSNTMVIGIWLSWEFWIILETSSVKCH